MSNNNHFEELQQKLKEMFQFDHNDLNFGIYKIYNLKNKEVEKFINGDSENSLKTTIQNSLKGAYNQENDTQKTLLKNFLGKLDQSSLLDDLQINKQKITGLIDVMGNGTSEKLKQALKTLETAQNQPETPEDKVYNHILNFFSLYYENGDFGYNERSISPYQVDYPDSTSYNGQDTMLFWKHKGQYYIKSGSGFNSVQFDLKISETTKKLEYRLETNEDSEQEQTARNNNKDDKSKHYKLNRIEEKDGVYQIIFNLAKISTTKEEVYKAILKQVFEIEYDDKYWSKKDGKSIFNDLKDKNQEIQNGNIKGLSQIRITKDELEKRINDGINRNDIIPQISKDDEIFTAFWSLDKSLNNFYIGNDSDFFIHQNLKEFLNKEQDKFIKNHILSDIYSLLEVNQDNQSLLIAKAFKKATDKIIEFLATVEDFQKKLFEKPKNVVGADYLITLDKIDPKHYSKILQNQKQIQNWIELGMIEKEDII